MIMPGTSPEVSYFPAWKESGSGEYPEFSGGDDEHGQATSPVSPVVVMDRWTVVVEGKVFQAKVPGSWF